jgi:hypothetical protein
MIGALSSRHNGFGNARRNMFPIWKETAGIQVLIACAIVLPTPLSRSMTLQKKMATAEQKAFCVLQFANQLFQFSGPSGDNFRVGISSFRQRGAFVKGKEQDVRVCQKKLWNEWDSFSSQSEKICAPCES